MKEKIKNICLILLGSCIVGFANALFIVPFDIIKGGMTSIAMVLSNVLFPFTNQNLTDIFLWILNIILWVVGLIFLGKKFAMSTLIGTIGYSFFFSLFLRIDIVEKIGLNSYYQSGDMLTKLILFGLAGGVISGLGLSLCLIGKGSTGGSDVISIILAKYCNFKQENASLLIDVIAIFLGFISYKDYGKILIGILSAFAGSLAVKNIYGKYSTIYILDIMTSKIEEVKTIISNEFLETCTIYNVEGGYSKESKKIIRCALEYKEAKLLKAMMTAIDKNAFITEYESTSTIGGSTFDAYVKKEEKDRILNLIKKK